MAVLKKVLYFNDVSRDIVCVGFRKAKDVKTHHSSF